MTNQPDADSHEAFVGELTACQDQLLLFIRALCGDPHLAADIRQAVNIVLWRKRDAFIPGTSFRAWAYRVAELEVHSVLRKRHRERISPLTPELLEHIAAELPAVIDELPERRLALAKCLERLTAKDYELIRHRYWGNGPLEDLAMATHRSTGTLKARLFQLRTALRRCIRQQLLHPEA
jgi:RNA polymerase sigma-70 factor (ECF subfamily)